MYAKLRPEPEMTKSSMKIFSAFDKNNDGFIDFYEFLVRFLY